MTHLNLNRKKTSPWETATVQKFALSDSRYRQWMKPIKPYNFISYFAVSLPLLSYYSLSHYVGYKFTITSPNLAWKLNDRLDSYIALCRVVVMRKCTLNSGRDSRQLFDSVRRHQSATIRNHGRKHFVKKQNKKTQTAETMDAVALVLGGSSDARQDASTCVMCGAFGRRRPSTRTDIWRGSPSPGQAGSSGLRCESRHLHLACNARKLGARQPARRCRPPPPPPPPPLFRPHRWALDTFEIEKWRVSNKLGRAS